VTFLPPAGWEPYEPPEPADPDGDLGEGVPLTPWDPGAPPLRTAPRGLRRALGYVPSRQQVLAHQVARALDRLRDGATIEQVADSIAVWAGDRDFLGVLFDARLVECEPRLGDH
jgi:hypothetical protein